MHAIPVLSKKKRSRNNLAGDLFFPFFFPVNYPSHAAPRPRLNSLNIRLFLLNGHMQPSPKPQDVLKAWKKLSTPMLIQDNLPNWNDCNSNSACWTLGSGWVFRWMQMSCPIPEAQALFPGKDSHSKTPHVEESLLLLTARRAVFAWSDQTEFFFFIESCADVMRIELQLGSAGRRYLDLTRFRHPLQGRGAKSLRKSDNLPIWSTLDNGVPICQNKGPTPWEFRHMYVESDRKRPTVVTGDLARKSGFNCPQTQYLALLFFFPAFASFGSLVDRRCMAVELQRRLPDTSI